MLFRTLQICLHKVKIVILFQCTRSKTLDLAVHLRFCKILKNAQSDHLRSVELPCLFQSSWLILDWVKAGDSANTQAPIYAA